MSNQRENVDLDQEIKMPLVSRENQRCIPKNTREKIKVKVKTSRHVFFSLVSALLGIKLL